jgi:hypothetical protein
VSHLQCQVVKIKKIPYDETDPKFTTWANSYSANLYSTYTTVSTYSALWNSGGSNTSLSSLTANWQNTFTNFSIQSANNISVYSTVQSNSANWNYQGTDVKILTANWQNTYTNVQSNSSNWSNVYTNVNLNSAEWNKQLSLFREISSVTSINSAIPVFALQVSSISANVDIALVAKGNGSFSLQIPDSTATNGNKRGRFAIDFQRTRDINTKVSSGSYSIILNGGSNTASGNGSNVINGTGNTASGNSSNVINGSSNTASANNSNIINGIFNTASGIYSNVNNGNSNTASGSYSNVINGVFNTASVGGYANVINGASNNASGTSSNVINGSNNTASGSYSNVINGSNNTASGGYSNVINGSSNTASGIYSNVINGIGNTASGSYSNVINGNNNTINVNGSYSTILNGGGNTISNSNGTILGGQLNVINSDYSIIYNSYGAITTRFGQESRTLSYFFNTGDAQRTEFILYGRSINAESVILLLGNSQYLTLTDNTVSLLTMQVLGVDEDANVSQFSRKFLFKRLSNVYSIDSIESIGTDSNNAGDCTFLANNNGLSITGSSNSDNNTVWIASIYAVELALPPPYTTASILSIDNAINNTSTDISQLLS